MNTHPRLASQAQPQQPMASSVGPVTSVPAWPAPPNPQGVAAVWARYLSATAVATPPPGDAPPPRLDTAEAARVQRHRDRLMAALQTQDRVALLRAKQDILEEAYCTRSAPAPGPTINVRDATTTGADSPALRSALRELSWRMAALLVPRSPRH